MASPAEVANDMAALADYWHRRDAKLEAACRDAAGIIRAFLAGERIDGRTYYGLHRRLVDLSSRKNLPLLYCGAQTERSMSRAQSTVELLYAEALRHREGA